RHQECALSIVNLSDRVVIVTGAGRGLGRTHALSLAGRGASVVVNDLSREHAESVVAEIEAGGGKALASLESISEPKNGQAIVDLAVDRFGTVDAIVNNAGFLRNAEFEEQTPDTLTALLDVHLSGPFFLTQAAWPVMRAQGYGRVVMTSSAGGMFAMGGQANYAAAKAGVYGLTKALAFEGRPHGILVNAVLPHANTEIRNHDPAMQTDPSRKEAERRWAAEHGANFKPGVMDAVRPVRLPEAVSSFVTFLASTACEITGEAFAVGCGRYARVFVGETLGWTAANPADVDPDDIVHNLDAVRSTDRYRIPENLYEEMELMAVATGRWTP
ncbi:MAG: Short-chain dehydrogenase/reductase, partial [Pseudonocardiales bacterium]|nr:Short-chain dehydrogenase/reductase [Pseudonocardiales bacterium]